MPEQSRQRLMNQTVLAFDYGLQNIGVAVGQTITHTASALTVLEARDGVPDWQQIATLLGEWQPQQLIVGLPLNMDGSDSELANRARKFARRLQGRFGRPVQLVDERLSTREAKSIAQNRGHRGNYADAPVDSLAAVIILQSWLDNKNRVTKEK